MADLFDRSALDQHRRRAAQAPVTFLHDEIAADLHDRLSEVKKTFTRPAVIGPMGDLLGLGASVADDDRLPLAQGAHDLVVHFMALHWATDPVGQMVQARLALRPDGLFLAAFPGGRSLHELRTALAEAESRLTGGLAPRVAPMGDLRDLGGLLQRAGLALPVADSRTITVSYPSLATLVRDLRGMGETNALTARDRRIPPRALFDTAEDIYRTHFGLPGNRIAATFEIVFLTGWAPDASQPQPLRPGSAGTRLADALGVPELKTGDSAAPGDD